MTFGRWLIAIALVAAPGLAQAQEGSGCGAFKWPLDHERGALVRTDKPSLPNGGSLVYDVAMMLELQPLSAAGLPKAPERASKSPTAFAGHFALAAPAKAGAYRVTISSRPGSTSSMAGPTCIRSGSRAQKIAKAHARASSSTCRPGRSRFSSAASRAIKSLSSFRPTNRAIGFWMEAGSKRRAAIYCRKSEVKLSFVL